MVKHADLEILQGYDQWIAAQEHSIVSSRKDSRPIEILEAGCGRSWALGLNGTEYRLTGIDLDKEALDHRLKVSKDLHEGIVGDLSDHDFGDRQFDVIYSAFVLEHIKNAEDVMKKFVRWLKPTGIMMIAVPDPASAYGFITRATPHWFHVLYYRYVYGFKDAGRPGFGPYRTYYDRSISREGMREFCAANNLEVIREYGSPTGLPSQAWRRALIRTAVKLLAGVSLGRLSSKHENLLYIIQKAV